MTNPIAQELTELAARDQRMRAKLLAAGVLHDGYHPQMEAVHRDNAEHLEAIILAVGWPTETLVGADAAQAAWLIAQHAIGLPEFQRTCLRHLEEAANRGLLPLWQPAMLEDRIRMFEGRPQIYGNQLEPDERGDLRPYLIEDPQRVDQRRQAVGLEPLAQGLARTAPAPPPKDRAQYERDYQEWLYRVGWRVRR